MRKLRVASCEKNISSQLIVGRNSHERSFGVEGFVKRLGCLDVEKWRLEMGRGEIVVEREYIVIGFGGLDA